jgi:type I restriction enzyme, S subunit
MTNGWQTARIGEVAKPIERAEEPQAGTTYRQVGVRLWGQGAYERESIDGSQTKYATLSRIESGDIIVNKIWARTGSVAIVTDELAGCFGSGEFPTFAPDRNKLEPKWFHWMTKTRWFWNACDVKSQGTSGKNRIRPEKFLEIEIPLPPLTEQRRIVEDIESLAARVNEAQRLREEAQKETNVLITSAQTHIFENNLNHLWAKKKLSEVALVARGKFSHRPRNEPRFYRGDIPLFKLVIFLILIAIFATIHKH